MVGISNFILRLNKKENKMNLKSRITVQKAVGGGGTKSFFSVHKNPVQQTCFFCVKDNTDELECGFKNTKW